MIVDCVIQLSLHARPARPYDTKTLLQLMYLHCPDQKVRVIKAFMYMADGFREACSRHSQSSYNTPLAVTGSEMGAQKAVEEVTSRRRLDRLKLKTRQGSIWHRLPSQCRWCSALGAGARQA